MPNDLVCFTNCLLPQEDGSLIEKDLWVDALRGVILDSQVGLAQFVRCRGSDRPCNRELSI